MVARIVAVLIVAPATILGAVLPAQPAEAAPSFDPGYIIADSLFYDGNAMTAAQIQSFLDSKIGTCQTDKCLNVAVLPVTSRPASYSADYPDRLACSAIEGGTLRVSELIYRTQVACGISAKVILVTLQKEQSLVTSRNPSEWQLRAAMGQACPDTGGCDSAYEGLAVQIMSGARQLSVYRLGNFRYKPGTQFVGYHPNTACGGTNVTIRNYATAALYNYTPYQPDAAALANLYGTGGSCSSYGNRNFWRFYTDWFGAPNELSPTGVTVSRVSGADRYQSSAAMSASYFAPNVPVVYIASGEGYADAISAAPAAAQGRGPVLLVSSTALPGPIRTEIQRLAPQRIVIVGGEASVSAAVAAELETLSPQVERVFGQNRFETSRAIMQHAFGQSVAEVYVATGAMYADALSASAAAGSRNAPVLLVDGGQGGLDSATRSLLSDVGAQKVYIAGGTGVVSVGIENALKSELGSASVVRLAGSDRYGTANAINRDRFATASRFFVASGNDFPDALGAAPIAALQGAPLYLTDRSCMPRSLLAHLIDAGASSLVIVGGTGVVDQNAAAFRNCW